MKTWMIRHQNLTFTKPIPESELIKKIESGEVLGNDEIAPSTGYWFSIQEIDEVRKHFGENIRLQSMIPIGAETTSSTNTALIQEKAKHDKVYARVATAVAIPVSEKRPKFVQVEKEDAPPMGARVIFGCFLILIFCGTLFWLWLGSQ